jgi:hypothetical protein
MKIDIDKDIRKAKTIPSRFYHSPKIYKKLRNLFDKSWQFIDDTSLLDKNNAHPGILLDGILNEPYVLTKKGWEYQMFVKRLYTSWKRSL